MTTCNVHLAAAAIVVSIVLHLAVMCAVPSVRGGRELSLLALRALGAAGWIGFLFFIVRPEDRRSTCLYPALLWGSMIWLADAVSNGALMVIEPQMLHGLFFGLSALVGSRPDAPHSNLFFYAVLIYMLFVLPVHDLGAGTYEAALAKTMRRVAILWSVGLLIAAGFLTRGCSAKQSE